MSYIINPETGRHVLADGKLGQQIIKQYGGDCTEQNTGYCELNKVDGKPKVNKNGSYSCRFKYVDGDSKGKRYFFLHWWGTFYPGGKVINSQLFFLKAKSCQSRVRTSLFCKPKLYIV